MIAPPFVDVVFHNNTDKFAHLSGEE